MAYTKRYEDSYLDKDDEEIEGITDQDRLVGLINKPDKSDRDHSIIKKLTDRLTNGAKMPGEPGKMALEGLKTAAGAYRDLGQNEAAISIWARLVEVGEMTGNKDLYYEATDQMENIG